MKTLPKSDNSLLLRTDFSDDAAWEAVCKAIQLPSEEAFQARVDCISDPDYDGLTPNQLVALAKKDGVHTFAFVVDHITLTDPERLVLVVDFYDQPGRTFRVIPREMWGVENNLDAPDKSVVITLRVMTLERTLKYFPAIPRSSRGA